MIASLSLLACSRPEPLDAGAVSAATELAAGVQSEALMATVEAVVAARALEEPVQYAFFDDPLFRVEAARWIRETLSAEGFTVIEERSTDDDIELVNLIVDLPGSTRPEELVLITAHFDSFYAGADDNASAIAVAIEAARLLRDQDLSRTVRLVFFDLEEPALVGAQRYYRDHAEDEVVGVLNMDCVGYASSAPGSQSAPTGLKLSDVGDFIAVMANGPAEESALWAAQLAEASGLPLKTLIGPGAHDNAVGGAFYRSDHAPAWVYGVPALFFTDTANFRNPHYHEETDTPETLDPAFLQGVGRVVAGLAYSLAEAE